MLRRSPAFALVVVPLLAAIGIYGVMAQSVIHRTPEIGVRVALGAQTNHLVRLVVGQGLRPAAIGIAAGLLLALFTTRILASLLYGVKPTDPITHRLGGVDLAGCSAWHLFFPFVQPPELIPWFRSGASNAALRQP